MTHGVNHVAITVADMKRTLQFYCGVLGMRLVGIFPMHGVPGAVHAFLDMGDGRLLSFIQFAERVEAVRGVSSPASPARPNAVGAMHHIALDVRDEAALEALRARVAANGRAVSQALDHGFCLSVYFAGPDGEQLEASTFTRGLDEREIDSAAAAHVGIAPGELAAMRRGHA